MTPVQLESRIAALRSSVRRLLALHGLSRVLGLIAPLVILAGLADWLFHLDAVIRAALLLSLIGGALWLAYRYVLRPLFVRFADLDIAMRIEERWPGLNDRLASMIQFVHIDANDDRYGSRPCVRRPCVRPSRKPAPSTFAKSSSPSRSSARSVWRQAHCFWVPSWSWFAPASSRIAMRRLALPFGATSWPQQTHLVLDEQETSLKVARGDSFTLGVKVRRGE